jgi:hypothetical protein
VDVAKNGLTLQPMPPTSFDSDPLSALLHEWRQTAMLFWLGLAAAVVCALLLPQVAWVVGVAVLGFPLVQLGQTIVIVGNELRKTGRNQSDEPR